MKNSSKYEEREKDEHENEQDSDMEYLIEAAEDEKKTTLWMTDKLQLI